MIIKKILPIVLFIVGLSILLLIFFDSVTGLEKDYERLIIIKSELTGSDIVIETDNAGYPLVNTVNPLEAAYITGYLHARSMLFRMEVLRHAGDGELSEFFGTKAVYADIFARTMGFRNTSLYYSGKLKGTIKDYIGAYVRGINKFIGEGRKRHPIEFSLLNHEPQPWKTEDVILMMTLRAWEENPLRFYPEKINLFARDAGADKWNPVFGSLNNTAISDSLLKNDFNRLLPERFIRAEEEFRKYAGMVTGDVYPVIFEQQGNFFFAGVSSYGVTALPADEYYISFRGDKSYRAGKTYAGIPFIYSGIRDSVSWLSSRTEFKDYSKIISEDTVRISMPYQDTIYIRDAPPVIMKFRSVENGTRFTDILEFPLQVRQGSKKFLSCSVYFEYDPLRETEILYGINHLINKIPALPDVAGSLKVRYYKPGFSSLIMEKKENAAPQNSNADNKAVEKDKKNHKLLLRNGVFSSAPMLSEIFRYGDTPEIIMLTTPPGSEMAELINFQSLTNSLKGKYAPVITSQIISVMQTEGESRKIMKEAATLLSSWEFDFDPLKQAPLIYNEIILKYSEALLRSGFTADESRKIIENFGIPYGLILSRIPVLSYSGTDSISSVKKKAETQLLRNVVKEALLELQEEYGSDISLWQSGKANIIRFIPLINAWMDNLPGVESVLSIGAGGSSESINKIIKSDENYYTVMNSKIITGGRYKSGFYVSALSDLVNYRTGNAFRETVISWARGRYYDLSVR